MCIGRRGIWQIGSRAPETHITPGSLRPACPQDVATLAGLNAGWAPLFSGPQTHADSLSPPARRAVCRQSLLDRPNATHTCTKTHRRTRIHTLIDPALTRASRNIPMATVFCLCSSELERFAPWGGGRTGGGQLNSTQQTLSQGSDYYCDNTRAYHRMHTNTPALNLLI